MKRAKHNLSHYHLTTAEMGQLIPIGCVEALPGDTFQHHTNLLVRLSPLSAPIMHPVTVRVHHFFVPYRLAWLSGQENWEKFITGGPTGDDAQVVPTSAVPGTAGDLYDYFGIPPTEATGVDVNLCPIIAYNLIYNEYYRDQDLTTARTITDSSVAKVAWEKDYFTAARPWTQKGPDVTLPIGTSAPVKGIGTTGTVGTGAAVNNVKESDGTTRNYVDGSVIGSWYGEENPTHTGFPNVYADLQNATGAKINDIRRAFAIQRYQEARARYGSRYTEYLRYLGVNPKDGRLTRPEYLGGGRTQLNVSEVLQTAPETGTAPSNGFGVGDLYGHGISALRSNKYRRFIEEHGFIISLMSVRPKTMYMQGIHRSWLRQDKEDFFQKELQHIGQQEVFNNEVYADAVNGEDTFGYQDRYREYREHPSYVSGEFRDVLKYWHMGREFATPPVLNSSFVECDPTKRIYQDQTNNPLWIMAQHKIVARRLVSKAAGGIIL